jgi:hypothetical protein
MDRSEKIVLSIFLGFLCLCLIVGIIFAGTYFYKKVAPGRGNLNESTPFVFQETLMVPTPVVVTGETTDLTDAQQTEQILKTVDVPSADWVLLAEKFYGKRDIPRALDTEPVNYKVGDTLDFWKTNVDTDLNTRITAYLAYETDDVYLWLEEGVEYDEEEIKAFMEKFSEDIYPTNQEFFGEEWLPGVDNDPHLYILFATDLGDYLLGYASSTDAFLPEVHEYSNVHEMFAMSADNLPHLDDEALSVLAHEFQHLIHGYHDANEETWLNEGFSELAMSLNGYDNGDSDYYFAQKPDIQLNEWPNNPNLTYPHYGSGFLFTTYLLDRFGEDTTKAVVSAQSNGLDSIDEVLAAEGQIDAYDGQPMTADRLFQDWTVANFLNDDSILDGRFAYHNLDFLPYFPNTEEFDECDSGVLKRDVSQYGADYIQIYCMEDYTLTFTGSPTVNVLPVSTEEGNYFIWSNKDDVSDMTMTQQFDFSGVSGDITLNYTMWYDIETDYDYVYLLSSSDGEVWDMINTPGCSTGNISGNNFGCGYNDVTDGWVEETVDLSEFTGQKVWLRFEYVTDTAVTGEGFALDEMSIPAIAYETDFATDDGGWDLQGFVRIQNIIPQSYFVSLIQWTDEGIVVLEETVAPGETLSFDIQNPSESEGVILVVSGATRYTRQKADYQIETSSK